MRLALALSLLTTPVFAQTCGGPLPAFLDGIRAEAASMGFDASATQRLLFSDNHLGR